MDAQQYLHALRKRWIAIVAFVIIGAGAGAGYASLQPVEYEATSSFTVNSNGGSTAIANLQGTTLAQSVVQTYAKLATQPSILNSVTSDLGLSEQDAAQLPSEVSANLEVDTTIVDITVTDGSPVQAAKIANSVVKSFTDYAAKYSGKPASIQVVEAGPATAPTSPSAPRWTFIVLTGAGLGLLVGLIYAIGRQLLSTRIGSEDDLRAIRGVEDAPFLGALSHRRRKGDSANVMLSDPHGIPAEEYRRVVTNVAFAGVDRRIRAVTITSAMPGEGKSTTALNVAAAAAEREQRVLLIDGDLRRPSVATYLGIDGGVGLTDVLLGTASPVQAIQRVGEMDVLPAGTVPPNVTQLVTSESMGRLFGELLMRYDFVVVDAPPLLPVIDALTFGRLTDGAILVARQRTTRRKQFAMAVESLEQVDAKILGVALNDVSRAESRYGYGYGYAAKDIAAVRDVAPSRDVTATFFPDDHEVAKDQAGRTFADH